MPSCRERTAPVDFSPGNGELILIADDEQAIRELVSEGLKANGFRVLAASNGEEALKLFQENAMEVRLFLTDQEMPVMNGVQAIAEIRKLKAKLPVIVTSGEGLSGDGTQLLSKPFSLEEVLTAVHQILSREKQESAGK